MHAQKIQNKKIKLVMAENELPIAIPFTINHCDLCEATERVGGSKMVGVLHLIDYILHINTN